MLCIDEVLKGNSANYILPFLWLHGEPHSVLKEEIDKIEACSIREICVESRPHPDYMGVQWWEDLDFIMEEARQRKMRVWVLDDDRFPTGHANGAYVEQPDKKKIYLAKRHMDLLGPVKQAAVLIENFLGNDGKLLAVFVCKRVDNESLELDIESVLDVTSSLKDGVVYFDIPKGFHRLIVLYTTQNNGGREDYMNLIDEASVQVLLDEVYEPHYARYKEDFGKTFAGFFSDEPELGNVLGYSFDEQIGKNDRHLPWSIQLHKRLEACWNHDMYKNLIGLWYDVGNRTKSIRNTFMDQITFLVDCCFARKIGAWCEARNIEYIGHIIEDDNAHTRLGCSTGHYFRAQKGQHMAGIDLVHLQLVPGFKEKYHQWIAGDQDGDFFHFGLAKLGSSLARLDPKKKGRSLCEIFGSYGWAEDVGLMKWLIDHMLVRGVNHFVPHAFSPKFPDLDCPPHFYARGNNPQYPYIISLMQHVNRMAHLLNGGYLNAGIGVLYHAEAEWSGGAYEPYQKIVRTLAEHQQDCTIISTDYLSNEQVSFVKGGFYINSLKYEMLLIPFSEYISDEVVTFVERAKKWEVPVFTTFDHPRETITGATLSKSWYEVVTVVQRETIIHCINEKRQLEIEVIGEEIDLRACTYVQPDGMLYFFFNEHPFNNLDTKVRLISAVNHRLLRYDSLKNTVEVANFTYDELHLKLEPGESACYFFDKEKPEVYGLLHHELSCLELEFEYLVKGEWKVSLFETGIDCEFKELMIIKDGDCLPAINHLDKLTRFSGIIRYESQFSLQEMEVLTKKMEVSYDDSDKIYQLIYLDLQGINDAVTIQINEKTIGMILSAPYRIDITDYIVLDAKVIADTYTNIDTNTISVKIDVVNTLTWRIHDGQSTHIQLNPTGMIERPIIRVYSN